MRASRSLPSSTLLAAGLLLNCVPALAEDVEVKLQIKDHHFVPEVITAPAGQKFKLYVHNEGTGPAEFESVDFHREKIIPAGKGKEITVFVGPLQPGTYEFFDDFHAETRGHLSVK
jgi:hypothetical protein